MSVKREPSGRRSVQVESEVPGTPEQVWQAIATGPGISSWFVPTALDGRVGGAISFDFGGGMVSSAKITAWQPPHRFVAEDASWTAGGPPVATEWTAEARSGGSCIVRVVQSLFASTDDWDGQLESTEHGWPGYFRVLRHHLTHYAGEPSAAFVGMAPSGQPAAAAWRTIEAELGIGSQVGGSLRIAPPGVAPIAGKILDIDIGPQGQGLTITTVEPAPGIVMISAMDCMGMQMAAMQAYYYGERAAGAAADADSWRQWLAALFPGSQPGESSRGATVSLADVASGCSPGWARRRQFGQQPS